MGLLMALRSYNELVSEPTNSHHFTTAYLKHILLFVQTGNPNKHLLRTLVDDWYAYDRKGSFLNRNGRPKWLNKPDPIKHYDVLNSMDFISKKAQKVLGGISKEHLVKEHAVPIATLDKLLTKSQPATVEDVAKTLSEYYRLGVLTQSEHEELTELGLRAEMPNGWKFGDSVFARYEKASICSGRSSP